MTFGSVDSRMQQAVLPPDGRPGWQRIDDARAVAVLFDAAHRARLACFVRAASTVAQVARRCGEDVRRTHYHVRRYVTLGLLEEVGLEQRAGRPQRLYRSPAQSWYVAHDSCPGGMAETALSLTEPALRSVVDDAVAAVDAHLERPRGRRFVLDRRDQLQPVAGPDPAVEGAYDIADAYAADAMPAVWLALHDVTLDARTAKAIQRALIDISRRIDSDALPDADDVSRVRLVLAMAPRRR